MHLAIPLQHLGFLIPGLDPVLPAEELFKRLSTHFAFLVNVQFELDAGTVRLHFSDTTLANRPEAECLAERAVTKRLEPEADTGLDLKEPFLTALDRFNHQGGRG